jgi:hypothetical protein
MAATHGVNWYSQLTALRAQMRPLVHALRQRGGPEVQQRGGNKGMARELKRSKAKLGASSGLTEWSPSKKAKRGSASGLSEGSPSKKARLRGATPAVNLPSSLPPHILPATDLLRDANAGQRVLSQMCNCSWWDWSQGSTLLFWRWPSGEQRRASWDGMEAYLQAEPPSFQQRVKRPKQEAFELLLPKFQAILARGYVVSNQDATELTELEDFIMSFIDYFGVPKADDVQVVYNGASCGLNDTVWAPNFWLPTAKSAARVLNFDYCCVDLDLGKMFLNFPLPMLFCRFSGIDLSPFKDRLGFKHVSNQAFQLCWERCWMGFQPSPYYSTRFNWAEEFARGDGREKLNPLRWDEVRLNLPGDKVFDPTLPRVMKWDLEINNIAKEVSTFVDDLRT